MTTRHVEGTLAIVARTLGVQVDEETYALFEHRRAEASQRAGAEISTSAYLRGVLRQHLNVSSNILPFTEGWLEGYKAGYAEIMQAMEHAFHDLQNAKVRTFDDLTARAVAGG